MKSHQRHKIYDDDAGVKQKKKLLLFNFNVKFLRCYLNIYSILGGSFFCLRAMIYVFARFLIQDYWIIQSNNEGYFPYRLLLKMR